MRFKSIIAAILIGVAVFVFAAPAHADKPTSKRAEAAILRQTPTLKAALDASGHEYGAPIFLRIVKSRNGTGRDGYLEAFLQNSNGDYSFFKRWDICAWSGDLGPKLKEGDGQSPEGFYFIKPSSLNPVSSYHLSFNLGFPNAYDRAHGRTGSFLMVHGNCVSIGCYAMTDEGIEEIYTLMDAAFENGQPFVRVHVFPFSMTDDNMAKFAGHDQIAFWRNLKEGWDWFENISTPPDVNVVNKTYVFNESYP